MANLDVTGSVAYGLIVPPWGLVALTNLNEVFCDMPNPPEHCGGGLALRISATGSSRGCCVGLVVKLALLTIIAFDLAADKLGEADMLSIAVGQRSTTFRATGQRTPLLQAASTANSLRMKNREYPGGYCGISPKTL
jgi:hypothetical protein